MDRRGIWICFALAAALSQAADEDCECVPYFQCVDGKIVTDGEGLLDVRLKTCAGIDVCCQLPTTTTDRAKPDNPQPVFPEPVDPEPVDGDPEPLSPGQTDPPPVDQATTPSGQTNPRPVDPTRINNSTKYTLPTVLGTPGCGRRRVGLLPSRISNAGSLADTFYGEAPWMVMIMNQDTFVCGGTLVKPSIVMTAAHCIPETGFSRLTVRVGEYNTSTTDEPIKHVDKKVKTVITHPDFNSKNLANDVALIELDTPAVFSETVDVICTPDAAEPVNTKDCVAYGWGVTDKNTKDLVQDSLKRVDLPVITRDECQNKMRLTRLGKYFSLLPGFLCAGGQTGMDTCKGDGGGPLICPLRKDSTRLAQVGIISWGIDCGKGNPTVFASVDHYMSWIRQQIA
ncbi:chymotrypsinogen A-like [Cimex lectularius]|uniref:Phenoloxidase-activating factor 2 n=1 Tax=Cimex lectularius TaxID=79782 RepID=A0A8I6SNI3_CIMLE|nr:chymotrypsinogen A-like [Cimex lectularius]